MRLGISWSANSLKLAAAPKLLSSCARVDPRWHSSKASTAAAKCSCFPAQTRSAPVFHSATFDSKLPTISAGRTPVSAGDEVKERRSGDGKEEWSGYSQEERERLGLTTNVEWAGGKVKGLSLHIERAYAELNLRPVQEQVGTGPRVRQHVNPLKKALQTPPPPPHWATLFQDPTLPLHVDIGSGTGRLLLLLAKQQAGHRNFLGLEIRKPLVARCVQWREELDLTNVHFVAASANTALRCMMESYEGPLALVSILCPDPHFKNRHRKRRVVSRMKTPKGPYANHLQGIHLVQATLVEEISNRLAPGAQLLLASDVEEVAMDMRACVEMHSGHSLLRVAGDGVDRDGWLDFNPLGVPTEREAAVIMQNGKMYRAMYEKI